MDIRIINGINKGTIKKDMSETMKNRLKQFKLDTMRGLSRLVMLLILILSLAACGADSSSSNHPSGPSGPITAVEFGITEISVIPYADRFILSWQNPANLPKQINNYTILAIAYASEKNGNKISLPDGGDLTKSVSYYGDRTSYSFTGLKSDNYYEFFATPNYDDGTSGRQVRLFSDRLLAGVNTDGDKLIDTLDPDDDNDLVLDADDGCPLSSLDWQSNSANDIDGDGCRDADEDSDDDNDLVLDADDSCPRIFLDWQSNLMNDIDGDGCRDADVDPDVNEDIIIHVASVDDSDNSIYELAAARSVTTAGVGGSTYMFVAEYDGDGVSVFSVAGTGSLSFVASVDDNENSDYELDGATSVATAEVGDSTYMFVAGYDDNGVSVFSVADNGSLYFADSVDYSEKDSRYWLAGARSVTTAEIGGKTYLFVAGTRFGAVSVFSVADTGSLSFVDGMVNSENSDYDLVGASSVTTAEIGDSTYLFVAGEFDNGVSVFLVADNGSLSFVDGVDDSENSIYELFRAISVTTARIGDSTYLFVAGRRDNGVSVFSVADNGSLSFVDSVDDGEDSRYELVGTRSVTTAEIGGRTYLFVAGRIDDGVSVFSVADNGSLSFVESVDDGEDSRYQLNGAYSVTAAEIGDSTHLFIVGEFDEGASVFSVADNGSLSFVESVDDNEGSRYRLNGANSVTTAEVGDSTYMFVAGTHDHGVSVFSVAATGSLSFVESVDDSEDSRYELEGAISVTTAEIGGSTYMFVAGWVDDGVSVFSVADNGSLSFVDSVDDGEDSRYELDGAFSVTTAEIGGSTYLFIAGVDDDGVSVFSVAANGSLSFIGSVDDSDNSIYELDGAFSVTTAEIGSRTYLFVAGSDDDGVSVFSVAATGSLSFVGSVDDSEDSRYELAVTTSVTTAKIGGSTYLFVSGWVDDGVSVFSIATSGSLSFVDSVDDSEDSRYQLNRARSVTTAGVGGSTYLFVAGWNDNGVSVFSVAATGSLSFVESEDDSENSDYELAGPISVTTAEIGGLTYLLVAGRTDDGVSIFRISGN